MKYELTVCFSWQIVLQTFFFYSNKTKVCIEVKLSLAEEKSGPKKLRSYLYDTNII